MPQVERKGIYKSWMRWSTIAERGHRLVAESLGRAEGELRHYVQTGRPQRDVFKGLAQTEPGLEQYWWNWMKGDLRFYTNLRSFLAQDAAMQGAADPALFANVVHGAYLAFLIHVQTHESFPRRFPGRTLKTMGLDDAMLLALALTLGMRREAKAIGDLLLEAYRRAWFYDAEYHPFFHFTLRLYADWSGQPPPVWVYNVAAEPVTDRLFALWRHPDPAQLAPCIVSACDLHTWHCRGSGKDFPDFHTLAWQHFPAEILMLYRLRQWSGLDNPRVDHPLLNSALGALPEPAQTNSDDLLKAVRARMELDGFDEPAIVASVLSHPA